MRFAHAHDNVNSHNLRMLGVTFSLDAAHIMTYIENAALLNDNRN